MYRRVRPLVMVFVTAEQRVVVRVHPAVQAGRIQPRRDRRQDRDHVAVARLGDDAVDVPEQPISHPIGDSPARHRAPTAAPRLVTQPAVCPDIAAPEARLNESA
jgi:hypothetical protein